MPLWSPKWKSLVLTTLPLILLLGLLAFILNILLTPPGNPAASSADRTDTAYLAVPAQSPEPFTGEVPPSGPVVMPPGPSPLPPASPAADEGNPETLSPVHIELPPPQVQPSGPTPVLSAGSPDIPEPTDFPEPGKYISTQIENPLAFISGSGVTDTTPPQYSAYNTNVTTQELLCLDVFINGRGNLLDDSDKEIPEGKIYYPSGTVITIYSSPEPGWVFSRWSGNFDWNENNKNQEEYPDQLTVTMDENRTITATFKPVDITEIRYILDHPADYAGYSVRLEGKYRGWESGHGTPPVTRSDWVLQGDDSSSIFVTGSNLGLRHPDDLDEAVVLQGIVRIKDDQPYIEIPSFKLDKDALLNSAYNCLIGNLNEDIDLMCESPDDSNTDLRRTYWLVNDNLLASHAVQPFNPCLSKKIMDALEKETITCGDIKDYTYKHNHHIEVLFGNTDYTVPPPIYTVDVCRNDPECDYIIKSERVNTGNTMEDAEEYLDRLCYMALWIYYGGAPDKLKDVTTATTSEELYTEALSLWDGRGFTDRAFNPEQGYSTYKLALVYYTASVLGVVDELSFKDQLLSTISRLQSVKPESTGGFHTFYKFNEKGELYSETSTNTETTSLVMIALNYHPDGNRES